MYNYNFMTLICKIAQSFRLRSQTIATSDQHIIWPGKCPMTDCYIIITAYITCTNLPLAMQGQIERDLQHMWL